MLHGLTILFLFRLLEVFVSGDFTCPGSDWLLDGSKCYKTINGSPLDGQAGCSNNESKSTLMLAPSSTEATKVDSLFPGEAIWVGLRYRNGAEWIWDNGSIGLVTWGSTPILPQLCITASYVDGSMFDFFCYRLNGLICQRDPDGSGLCELGWTNFGTNCFKRLRQASSGVSYSDGSRLCNDENAFIMMPHSKSESLTIATNLDCAGYCWIGLTDFDADHTYTWEDGTDISQFSLYFGSSQPNGRNLDYICAYIQNGEFYNEACTTSKRIICQIDGTLTTVSITEEPISSTTVVTTTVEPISSTTVVSITEVPIASTTVVSTTEEPISSTTVVSTTEEPIASTTVVSTTEEQISSTDNGTKVMSTHLSTGLILSTPLSSVVSKTSMENLHTPTRKTKFTNSATEHTTDTQNSIIRPTTISSPKEKSNCSKSSTNSCRCQKRAVANTTGNQTIQTLKVTDYIWLNKCAMQPLIDAGMVDVTNCPYVCKCSPKGTTTSEEDMFACVRRP